MGWAVTREENEITNDREERDGKRVARLSTSTESTTDDLPVARLSTATDYQPVYQSALAIE